MKRLLQRLGSFSRLIRMDKRGTGLSDRNVGLPTHLQDIAGFAQEGLGDADSLLARMAQDKKVKRGKLTFILMEAIGRAVIANDVDPARVREFLQAKLARRV